MAKKKRKKAVNAEKTNPKPETAEAITEPIEEDLEPDKIVSQEIVDTEVSEEVISQDNADIEAPDEGFFQSEDIIDVSDDEFFEPEDEKDVIISQEIIDEIGSPDRDLVFKKVAKAYEEAKRTRAKYKKAGPAFVIVSGIVFLFLMFALDYKVAFLILWVTTTLFTAALMIRAEYHYHKFRYYLGLAKEESNEDTDVGEEDGTDPDKHSVDEKGSDSDKEGGKEEQSDLLPGEQKIEESLEAEQEEQA